ncbi:MAG: DUF1588 domain-containing protein [Verrucomicrobiota bacterium]
MVGDFRVLSATLVGANLLLGTSHGESPELGDAAFAFLDRYCMDCHDRDVQKGDRDFEVLNLPLQSVSDLVMAKDIIDQVTLKEMPPKDADQPTDEERLAVIRALRQSIASAKGRFESSGGRTVMRRLSNREYENTLAVLFDRRVDTLGLTADFPKEKTSRHIDTIGNSLITSGFLLDQYFQSAHRLVEARLGKPEIEPQDWHFTDNFRQYEELSGSHRQAFNYKYLCLYEQPNTDTRQGGYGHIEDFLEGVPVSGLYDIQILAQALHRDTHYDPEIFKIDLSEPFQVAVIPGDVTKGHIHYPQAIEPILAQTTVPDDKPTWLSFRVWLEAGQTPRFIFPNGPYESRRSIMQINRRYKDEFSRDIPKVLVGRTLILQEGKLPHIRIGEIKIHGPVPEATGSAEEVAVFGEGGFQPEKALEQLYAFAERAYRRPLGDEDRDRIDRIYKLRTSEEATSRQAALDALKLILCSPSFLYLSEITDETQPKLGPHDLASRLSYALWTAPPDEELVRRAGNRSLMPRRPSRGPFRPPVPKELRQQVYRLLTDERSEEFVNGFLDSWLNLRDLGGMPPPRSAAENYYAENLPVSMKQEIRIFFRHLLDTNGSVLDFLDADYSFVDKRLAQLYQLPEQNTLRLEDGFQRVSFEGNGQRGGLLGMAGVLTVSSNGVETSPVTRGVWVSENILGIEPAPPPDEVPAIENDVRGATTIRERLNKHSADKTCAECHRKIDPLGFGLETFDPIGRWRQFYPKPKGNAPAPKVDSSGEFPSGEAYADFDGLKSVIVKSREEYFTRHLIKTFLSYATGRHMEPVDDFEIDEIYETVRDRGYGLRTLIVECLSSDIFQSR